MPVSCLYITLTCIARENSQTKQFATTNCFVICMELYKLIVICKCYCLQFIHVLFWSLSVDFVTRE